MTKRKMSRFATFAAIIGLGLGLVFAGCGDGGSTNPFWFPTTEPTSEEPTSEEPSTEEPSTEEPSSEDPSTEQSSSEEPSEEETEEPYI